MSDDDDYKVGYGKPPISGRIKPGERRNPKGRPKKITETPALKSDADILDVLDNELVPYKGGYIPKREAMVRVLHSKATAGDMKALQVVENMRQASRSTQAVRGSPVLAVPGMLPFDEWSIQAAVQQAKFRGEDPEGLARLEAREKGDRGDNETG